jgi:dienelactone hydrolase
MEQRKATLGERWSDVRATKTVVFWSCVASVVLTMIVGFSWGGWVTGSTALKMAEAKGEDAVVDRLAPFCVARVNADPKKAEKIKELKDVSAWERGDYVKKQGWATMPGEKEPDSKIADACAKLITA